MAVTKRHQAIQMDYMSPFATDMSWFLSVSSHKHWGNFAEKRNMMLFAGMNARF